MPGKKANSVIFMVVATLLNILLLAVLFFVGIFLLSFMPADANPQWFMIGIVVVFLGSIGLSFVIYNKVLKWAIDKFSLEDKMDPLFAPKRRPRKPSEE